MEANVDGAVAVERVAWVGASCVGTEGALEAARVVAVEEVVVPLWVRAELRVVTLGRDRTSLAVELAFERGDAAALETFGKTR